MKKRQNVYNPLLTIALVKYKEIEIMKATGREIKAPVDRKKKRK